MYIFEITPALIFRDAALRDYRTGRAYRKTERARAHFDHRLRSILRRRRLPLWCKFNYVFTLNLHRCHLRMVCMAMGLRGSVCVYIFDIYICVRAGKPVWSCCGLIYYALAPAVDSRASRFHVHLRNVVCFYPHTNTLPPLSRCNPHTEDLAPRRPPGRGGLIATARNAICTST